MPLLQSVEGCLEACIGASGLSQAELSEATLRDAPTMSRIVRGMEERDMVERRRSAEDGRVQQIFLTPHGRSLRRKLVPVARALVERLVRGVPKTDLSTTRRTLERMFENLQA